jgi:multiple sugar transport system substrate-binding protein
MPTQNGDNGGTITLSGGWGFAIPAKSKHQIEAWDFIKFISSRENNLKLALSTGNLSPRLDVAEDQSYRAVPFQEFSTGFLKNAAFRPKNDKYPAVSTEIQSMVEAVATGTTLEKAMAAYRAGVTRVAGEDKVKEIK